MSDVSIQVTTNGPLRLSGSFQLTDAARHRLRPRRA